MPIYETYLKVSVFISIFSSECEVCFLAVTCSPILHICTLLEPVRRKAMTGG